MHEGRPLAVEGYPSQCNDGLFLLLHGDKGKKKASTNSGATSVGIHFRADVA